MIAVDLGKQQPPNADSKAIQQVNFGGNLNWVKGINDNTTMFFNIEEVKETILDFCKELWEYYIHFVLIWYQYKITQHNTLNVKLSNLQLSKLKSGIKNGPKVTFIKCCWWFCS